MRIEDIVIFPVFALLAVALGLLFYVYVVVVYSVAGAPLAAVNALLYAGVVSIILPPVCRYCRERWS